VKILLTPEEREFVKLLGNLIRRQRLEMNISQEELAEKIGISSATLLNMEKGSGSASFDKWVAVLSFTGYLKVLESCIKEHTYNPFDFGKKVRKRASKNRNHK